LTVELLFWTVVVSGSDGGGGGGGGVGFFFLTLPLVVPLMPLLPKLQLL
jgi:hypothetical protein